MGARLIRITHHQMDVFAILERSNDTRSASLVLRHHAKPHQPSSPTAYHECSGAATACSASAGTGPTRRKPRRRRPSHMLWSNGASLSSVGRTARTLPPPRTCPCSRQRCNCRGCGPAKRRAARAAACERPRPHLCPHLSPSLSLPLPPPLPRAARVEQCRARPRLPLRPAEREAAQHHGSAQPREALARRRRAAARVELDEVENLFEVS
jgi:hypothetical protein